MRPSTSCVDGRESMNSGILLADLLIDINATIRENVEVLSGKRGTPLHRLFKHSYYNPTYIHERDSKRTGL